MMNIKETNIMRNLLQRTLKNNISCTGIGLHSGEKIQLTLRPAPEGSGISFYRTDIPGAPPIKASLDQVIYTRNATTLGNNGVSVATVEHLLAALAGLGVDNARVDVSGPEVPIMDGSSFPFVYLIKNAGIRSLNAFKKFIVIRQPLFVEDNDKYVAIAPGREFSIDFHIGFDHPVIRNQSMCFRFSDEAFERDLARARTFGFLHEVEYLKKNGLAKGGSLANAVVVDRYRILNQDGLRYPDEFVRHKILDFIGDISLMGMPIIGCFKASKSGHTLNHALLTQLASTPEAWKMIEFKHPDHCIEQNVRIPSWGLPETPARQAA